MEAKSEAASATAASSSSAAAARKPTLPPNNANPNRGASFRVKTMVPVGPPVVVAAVAPLKKKKSAVPAFVRPAPGVSGVAAPPSSGSEPAQPVLGDASAATAAVAAVPTPAFTRSHRDTPLWHHTKPAPKSSSNSEFLSKLRVDC